MKRIVEGLSRSLKESVEEAKELFAEYGIELSRTDQFGDALAIAIECGAPAELSKAPFHGAFERPTPSLALKLVDSGTAVVELANRAPKAFAKLAEMLNVGDSPNRKLMIREDPKMLQASISLPAWNRLTKALSLAPNASIGAVVSTFELKKKRQPKGIENLPDNIPSVLSDIMNRDGVGLGMVSATVLEILVSGK